MVCNYCSCPPQVDPGCPPQSAACAFPCPSGSPSAAPTLDQGILSIMNEALPGCEVNQDYARWAQETGNVKSVAKNQQCPVGYEMLAKTNKLYSNSLYDTCKLLNMSMPVNFDTRLNACVYGGRSPASSSGLPMWALVLIIICVILIPVGVSIALFR